MRADDAVDEAEDFVEYVAAWVDEKYRENPALVIALAAVAGPALLIGASAIVRALFRR